ncbi:hypothetical protein HJFPF1_03288 [Paramyrothecium foliicola]|nr:hypothetical protein HJFPF1_03288 [Paramyrothecium foliicola]
MTDVLTYLEAVIAAMPLRSGQEVQETETTTNYSADQRRLKLQKARQEFQRIKERRAELVSAIDEATNTESQHETNNRLSASTPGGWTDNETDGSTIDDGVFTPSTGTDAENSSNTNTDTDDGSKPADVDGGPIMALDCPPFDFHSLHRLYWESEDPVLRQSIFWKLWGTDRYLIRQVDRLNDIWENGNPEEVDKWIGYMLGRRGWWAHEFSGDWKRLTAAEMSRMTLRQLKWRLRVNRMHWFFCPSSKAADLPARDVAVAMAVCYSITTFAGGASRMQQSDKTKFTD